jgi:hypothetical protein
LNNPIVIVQDAATAYEFVRQLVYDPGQDNCKLEEFRIAAEPFMEIRAKIWAVGSCLILNSSTGEIYSELLEDYVDVDEKLASCIDNLWFQIFGRQHD